MPLSIEDDFIADQRDEQTYAVIGAAMASIGNWVMDFLRLFIEAMGK
ncbi:MAG: hypothetical protein U1G05_19460 [Kiritimatiellia bacterium]